jgi:hypothetical protein
MAVKNHSIPYLSINDQRPLDSAVLELTAEELAGAEELVAGALLDEAGTEEALSAGSVELLDELTDDEERDE